MNTIRQPHYSSYSYFWRVMSLRGGIVPVCLLIFITSVSNLFGQITGPEQDCDHALPVCQEVYVQPQTYQGVGAHDELPPDLSCLENEENNSVWYIFTVTASGMLEFDIAAYNASANNTVDYDFALYNITGKTCANISDG